VVDGKTYIKSVENGGIEGIPKQASTSIKVIPLPYFVNYDSIIPLNMATTTSIFVKPVELESITLDTSSPGSLSTEDEIVSLLRLPTELKLLIIQNLDLVDQICLKMTCQPFNALIPRLAMPQLLEVELSPYATQSGKERYACKDCLRLLPKTAFGDQMVKGKKGKNGTYRENRFCVQCGINPRPGTTRYSRGACIERQGEHFVVCLRCAKYGRGAVEGLCKLAVCQGCRMFLRAAEVRDEERTAKAEQSIRRVERRLRYGSEYEDSDLEYCYSPAWSDDGMWA
jgi:hypothetical protein